MLLALQQNLLLGDAPTLVTVPDVVGETQAQATIDLEAVLFVVAVETAYSSSVAAGVVISQSPAGGVDAVEGSTVTITVSLGDQPVTDQPGSGGFYYEFELNRRRRAKRKRELEEQKAEQERIQEERDREIARLLREQQEKEDAQADLKRLQVMADKFAGSGLVAMGVPRPVTAAILKAHEERTRNALEQMERMINRMMEEEEIALVTAMLLID